MYVKKMIEPPVSMPDQPFGAKAVGQIIGWR